MQEGPRQPLQNYARLLAYSITVVFWFFSILIGFFISTKESSKALFLLLILSTLLPVFVTAAIQLLREKHNEGSSISDLKLPAFYIFYPLLFIFIAILLPDIIG
jgi:NADH:ubiquinone oxidoreductase subunit 2 (subunit N)